MYKACHGLTQLWKALAALACLLPLQDLYTSYIEEIIAQLLALLLAVLLQLLHLPLAYAIELAFIKLPEQSLLPLAASWQE